MAADSADKPDEARLRVAARIREVREVRERKDLSVRERARPAGIARSFLLPARRRQEPDESTGSRRLRMRSGIVELVRKPRKPKAPTPWALEARGV